MKVEVLYFEGCPNHAPALAMVRRVLERERIEAEVRSTEVPDETAADSLRFLGSPSIRVDGVDIEPGRADDLPFFGCRTYTVGGKTVGVPPEEWLLQALRRPETATRNVSAQVARAGAPIFGRSGTGTRRSRPSRRP